MLSVMIEDNDHAATFAGGMPTRMHTECASISCAKVIKRSTTFTHPRERVLYNCTIDSAGLSMATCFSAVMSTIKNKFRRAESGPVCGIRTGAPLAWTAARC